MKTSLESSWTYAQKYVVTKVESMKYEIMKAWKEKHEKCEMYESMNKNEYDVCLSVTNSRHVVMSVSVSTPLLKSVDTEEEEE